MLKYFIHRPIFAIVIALVIIIAGLVAIFTLPVAQYPPISPPTVTVETFYVGASARVVEENVAVPIEQEVNGAREHDLHVLQQHQRRPLLSDLYVCRGHRHRYRPGGRAEPGGPGRPVPAPRGEKLRHHGAESLTGHAHCLVPVFPGQHL